MKSYDGLLKGDIGKTFTRYVMMNTAGMLMISMYILFDTIFIGQRLGKLGLAALNISIQINNLLFGTGLLIGTGSGTIIAISLGKDKKDDANIAYEHSILLGIIVGIIYTILGLLFMDYIIKLLGASS